MLAEPIDVNSAFPGGLKYIQNGDPLSTGNFQIVAADMAAAVGYLKLRLPAHGGVLTTSGAGAVAITAGTGGYTVSLSGSFVRVTFSVALPNANYGVIVTPDNDANGFWGTYDAKTTAKVDLALWSATGTQMNLAAAVASFTFAIYTYS